MRSIPLGSAASNTLRFPRWVERVAWSSIEQSPRLDVVGRDMLCCVEKLTATFYFLTNTKVFVKSMIGWKKQRGYDIVFPYIRTQINLEPCFLFVVVLYCTTQLIFDSLYWIL